MVATQRIFVILEFSSCRCCNTAFAGNVIPVLREEMVRVPSVDTPVSPSRGEVHDAEEAPLSDQGDDSLAAHSTDGSLSLKKMLKKKKKDKKKKGKKKKKKKKDGPAVPDVDSPEETVEVTTEEQPGAFEGEVIIDYDWVDCPKHVCIFIVADDDDDVAVRSGEREVDLLITPVRGNKRRLALAGLFAEIDGAEIHERRGGAHTVALVLQKKEKKTWLALTRRSGSDKKGGGMRGGDTGGGTMAGGMSGGGTVDGGMLGGGTMTGGMMGGNWFDEDYDDEEPAWERAEREMAEEYGVDLAEHLLSGH